MRWQQKYQGKSCCAFLVSWLNKGCKIVALKNLSFRNILVLENLDSFVREEARGASYHFYKVMLKP